jgi:hypothetical protein
MRNLCRTGDHVNNRKYSSGLAVGRQVLADLGVG